MAITQEAALKVLETVDAGLTSGVGVAVPGQMCVMAAVNYALGEPHGDSPSCVHPALRAFDIRLNDACWSSNQARARGLRREAIAKLGSQDIDPVAWVKYVAEQTIRRVLPVALRRRAESQSAPLAERLVSAALRCENEGTKAAAEAAAEAAGCAAGYAAGCAAAEAAAVPAAEAAAVPAARAAARAAACAAAAAARAAQAADEILGLAAEISVEACILCRTEGSEFLFLVK